MRASCRYRAPNKKKGKVEEASEGLHAGGDNVAVAWQESEEDVLWVPPSGQTGTLLFTHSLSQLLCIETLLLRTFPTVSTVLGQARLCVKSRCAREQETARRHSTPSWAIERAGVSVTGIRVIGELDSANLLFCGFID